MDNLRESTEKLNRGVNLQSAEAEHCARCLGLESISLDEKIQFLKALSIKGETSEEVSAFASVFRSLAIDPELSDFAQRGIDVCGTGGDGFGTFNISTTVAFVLAAAGVPVLKHGNRSITSQCGSADLMEAVGIQLIVDLPVHRQALESLNFTFFFAPAFHPVFKAIMPARKALAADGQKTIFNLLGPMINPAQPKHQLMGVFARQWIDPIAEAMDALGLEGGMIVHGEPVAGSALDELSCAGVNHFRGFGRLADQSGLLDLSLAGLTQCAPEALKGGSVADNCALLDAFAKNDREGISKGLRESIYLNVAAAFLSLGQVGSLSEGVERAAQTVEGGVLSDWLKQVKAFYASLESA
ncbi:MAG: anthranilate phosphoribosyltransferase [Puniceicoccaceae bacterium]|nr:MAG: anthranilate phosphoribosyltransferase [Puniceicoccaceae bacterium]